MDGERSDGFFSCTSFRHFASQDFVNDILFVSRFFLGFMIQVQKLFPGHGFLRPPNAIPSGDNQ